MSGTGTGSRDDDDDDDDAGDVTLAPLASSEADLRDRYERTGDALDAELLYISQ